MINDIIQFRSIYLQAIAKAWSDENFYSELVIPAKEFNSNLSKFLSGDNTVAESYKGFDRSELLSKTFDFDFPWPRMSVIIINNDTYWSSKYELGWVGINDLFIVQLPQAPYKKPSHSKKEDPAAEAATTLKEKEMAAEAVTAYYRLFPTLLGLPHEDAHGSAQDDQFLEFGRLTLRVVGTAWADPKFTQEITNPDLKNADPLLSKYFKYNNPWNFNIRFRNAKDFRWVKTSENSESPSSKPPQYHWENIPNNIMVLNYPNRPAETVDFPLALADYNNSGSAYPYTCP